MLGLAARPVQDLLHLSSHEWTGAWWECHEWAKALGRVPGQPDTDDHHLGHGLGLPDLVGGRGWAQEPWQLFHLWAVL